MPINNDSLDELFKELENLFDIDEPHTGHQERFLTKLQKRSIETKPVNRNRFLYRKSLSIAASLLILIGVGIQLLKSPANNISPEVKKTQFYFTSLLNEEMEKLTTVATPDTKILVSDTMKQLEKLQNDFLLLEIELEKTGDTNKILYAMMVNFQTRIDLLQEVIKKIEDTKKLKKINTNNYEGNSI